MGANEASILESVARQTQSELIMFFIIVAVVVVVITVPLYTVVLKDKKQKNQLEKDKLELENDKLEKYMDREKRIIEVVTANTTIMSSLKETLEKDGVATNNSLTRIHERIDSQANLNATHGESLMRISATLDESLRNQTSLKEDIKKILLIVDNIPQKAGIRDEN